MPQMARSVRIAYAIARVYLMIFANITLIGRRMSGMGKLDLNAKVEELAQHRNAPWAWENYLATVRDVISGLDGPSVLEIGGGRFPALTREEMSALGGGTYTTNDISERELSLAPDWVERAHFDIQTPDVEVIEQYRDKYDIAFSRMVMEHVPNYLRAYRNIHTVLRDGGISIAFHPVLYSVPFVLNWLIPEQASRRLLTLMFPHRTDAGTPKFPAVYSGCRISAAVRRNLKDIGFRNVWQLPFYGHTYYSRMPGIRDVHAKISETLAASNTTVFATYAYTIVQK